MHSVLCTRCGEEMPQDQGGPIGALLVHNIELHGRKAKAKRKADTPIRAVPQTRGHLLECWMRVSRPERYLSPTDVYDAAALFGLSHQYVRSMCFAMGWRVA